MVLDKECKIDFEEHMATMLQNKAMIQNNVLHKRKKQLEHWEHSELNQICPKRNSSYHSKVKFQNRDIFLSACQSGDEDEVEELLNKGSDINSSTIDGVTALHQAVIDGNMDIVRFLVQHNADINAQDNEGWTPLHAAVCCGNLNIAKYLYENNADLACVNSDRELPVDLAESDEMRNYLEEVMRLKNIDERKARETEFNTMLEDCRSLINSGKPFDTPHPKTGATALHVAASRGYIKIIEMLINAGADVNAPDFEGWTPLHAADHWGERDACRILEENGAKFEASDIDQKIQRLVESQVEDTEKTHYNCRQQSKEDYTSNGSNNSSDDSLHKDSSKQFAEMKLKHQDMEREKTALEGDFGRSEVQLKSFKTIAEQSEKVPEELQKQNRQLKKESTPESAPLVQSARLFWNSIENNCVNSIQNQLGQQNHPIVTTQLHQQQFLRSRQKFALANQCSVESSGNSSSSVSSLTNNTSQSPFAFVAGEQQKQPFTTKPSSHIFKRAESLKVVGSNFNNSNNNGVNAIYINSNIQQQPQQQQTIPPQQQQFMLWRQQTVTSKDLLKDPKERKNFVKTTRIVLPPPPKNTKEDLNKNKPLLPLTAAFTSSISNNVEGTTTPPSESCSSSIAASPSSLSPLVNFPFVTVRKQSLIQTTPPTQPTSQKESESERKAKSKLKRSTRRSTQGVTLEQLGEAAGRHSGSHNNNGNHHQPNHGDRVQRANEKFNCFMEVTKDNKEIHEELKFLKKTVQDLQNQQYHLKNEILWRDKLIHENGFVVVNQDPNDDFLQSLHHRNISENGNDSTKNKFEPLLLSYVTLAAVEKALPGTSAVDQKIQRINRKLRQKVEEAEKTLYNCRQQSQEDYTSNGSNSSNDDSLHKDASKQFAEMKLKLQEMEREKTALEGAFGRSETQLKRFKTIAEQSEKESEELQKQNRQLKKELRDKEQSLEESKETINQLQSRLEKMRNTKRPI